MTVGCHTMALVLLVLVSGCRRGGFNGSQGGDDAMSPDARDSAPADAPVRDVRDAKNPDAATQGPVDAATDAVTDTAPGDGSAGATYQWVAGSWGDCNSIVCQGGQRERAVTCQTAEGDSVAPALCPAETEPPSTEACSSDPCYHTVRSDWCYGVRADCLSSDVPAMPACPSGYVDERTEFACGNPNFCGTDWALCAFYQVHGWGCVDYAYSLHVGVRQCTGQGT